MLTSERPALEGAWVRTGMPVEIEIGCGKARYLIARAMEEPEAQFVGIERVRKWARVARQRVERKGLDNLRILNADAREMIACDVPSGSVSRFHMYFPDPWPKRRHRKRRMLSMFFLGLLNDRLRVGGTVEFSTDFAHYFEEVKGFALRQGSMWSACRSSVNEPVTGGGEKTNYELKYILAGRDIYYLEIRK